MASPVVSRHTIGSNHIWKTSSGKSDLKSHFTVSQRLGVRDEEGMKGQKRRFYSHCVFKGPSSMSFLPLLLQSHGTKFMSSHQVIGRTREKNYKVLMAS